MQIQIESQPFAAISTEALVTFVFDKDERIEGTVATRPRNPSWRRLPKAAS